MIVDRRKNVAIKTSHTLIYEEEIELYEPVIDQIISYSCQNLAYVESLSVLSIQKVHLDLTVISIN